MDSFSLKRSFLFAAFILITTIGCTQVELDVTPEEEPYPVEEVAIVSDESGWDIPTNEGIRNELLNAEQLSGIQYKPIRDLYKVGGTFDAGTNIKGLIYSSTRAEDLLVPNNVSLWTFMSSLKNPNSYLYTVDITEPPYSIQGSARPYYGQVCTSVVQYAMGIKYNFQIHQMTVWEGIDKVVPQDIEKLRLGDILTTERGHTRLVTGIHRGEGHVTEVEITEGMSPCVKRKVYPVQEVLETFNDEGYVFYRYRYINDTKHIMSPFVSVGSDPPVDDTVFDGMVVIPRRGDKANWRKDEEVVLDVVDRGNYSYYELFREGLPIRKQMIPENDVINLGVMPYGEYSLQLIGNGETSVAADWIVADYSISAQAIGGRKAKVSFSSKNATPIWVTWRIPAYFDERNNNMPLWTTVITDEDRANGFVVTELDSYIAYRRNNSEWDLKVAFETPYGIISSDSKSVYIE